MQSGPPRPGDLYVIPSGRTVEILAVEAVNYASLVDTAQPVGTVTVFAYKILGTDMVRITSTVSAQDWVKTVDV